jgi:sugar phosphate isomerase/epimerase
MPIFKTKSAVMNRKDFFKLGMAAFLLPPLFSNTPLKSKRRLCFNTLGCPQWNLKEIMENAQKMGYGAVEIRGLLEEVDIAKSPAFQPNKLATVKQMALDHGITLLNLNSSAVLHEYETEKRKFNLDTAKRYIDMAHQLDCPYIRVFPEKFHPEKPKAFSLDIIQQNLSLLADYCKGSNVKVLLDAHGDLVWSDDIKAVMKEMDPKHTGIIWDFYNMHLKTKESPKKMFKTLRDYIALVQIKDGRFRADKAPEYTLTGKGDFPIAEILKLLDADGYPGFISFEWEKRWHPEWVGPEIAFPQFIAIISDL